MLQLKIFIIMFCFLFSLFFCITNKILWFTLVAFLFIFIYKYIVLKNTLSKYNDITKKALHSQREFFINSLTHDLRTPVIAQIRALELLKNENLGELNKTQIEMLNQTEQSCRCILNLISLLINTYNIENSSYSLIYNKFNLYEVILFCFEELSNIASEKNITFEYDCKDKNLCLFADIEEIKKVIKNLLITAINYSNSGEIITVKLENINRKLKLSVEIKECIKHTCDEQKFDSRFTAIGECIRFQFCKKIIELHKGKILQNNGKPRSFVFELPISA